MRLGLLFVSIILCATSPLRAENWPQWRGPLFNGSTTETNLPADLSASNHLAWVAPLPLPGAATPVVWGDRLFLTASDKTNKAVFALGLDARTGRELWRHELVLDTPAPARKDMGVPSPVTDGHHVWFLTGNGTLTAFTVDGREVWRRDLGREYGVFVNNFGYSSSPLLFEDKLYILALQNENPQKEGLNPGLAAPLESYLLALDPATGRTLWRHVRPTDAADQSREAYNTPYPLTWNGRKEIVLCGGECLTGHNPATGAELWRWWFTPPDRQTLQHVVPTPVADGGLIFAVRPEHRPLYAVRANGSGTLPNSALAWTYQTNQCWIASPLLYRGRLYVPQEEQRTLVCLEPATGRVVWERKLPVKTALQASPTGADGKVYLISLGGDVVVLEAGDEYRELSSTRLPESQCRASIVAANGRLYIRGSRNLYCFENRPSGEKQ